MISRRSAVTGIDLGHQAVKIVRLENGLGNPRLTHWGVEEIPVTVEAGPQDRIHALGRLMRRVGLRRRHLGRIAAAVGGRDVHIRQVSMPRLSPEEIRKALPYEARKHLPIEHLTEPCLDFQVLHGAAARNGREDTQEVLLVAAPLERRNRTLEVLERAGIHPEILDAQPLPVVNAVLAAHPPAGGDGWIVILDVGARVSTLAAVLPDGGFYSRPLAFTGETLTGALEEGLQVDRPSAEIIKRELGTGSGRGERVAQGAVRNLTRELEETIRFLRFRKRDEPVARVYLCGGGALVAGLRERVELELGVDVIHPDPFHRTVSKGRPGPAETLRLVGALGLASWWE